MQKNWHYLIVLLLFFATAVPIFYKTSVLEMELFPKNKMDAWELEYLVKVPASDESQLIEFAIPKASEHLTIEHTEFEGKHLSFSTKERSEGVFARLEGATPQDTRIFYKVQIQTQDVTYAFPKKDYSKSYPKNVRRFVKPLELSESFEDKITVLEQEILLKTKNKAKQFKNLFYFVYEEIINSRKSYGSEKALLFYKGSTKDKADLLTILSRRQGIPTRTVRGIALIENKNKKQKTVHWNEVYLNKQWIPAFASHTHLGFLPKGFVPLYSSVEMLHRLEKGKKSRVRFQLRQVLSDEFNAQQYKKELESKASWYLSFSPHKLPISEQASLKLLLLFCLGCVVLAVSRNLLGIKTFGIFFPILLALFMKDTSVLFGLGFFAFVILLGFAERRLLQKMHLLAVPRFSIILTFLVITLLLFAVVNHRFGWFEHNPTLLPIIITTMFIERFSVTIEEEGTKNAFHAFLGTVFITALSYLLFLWEGLEIFIYTHPESLFSVVAILILIGKYTGYRLSELFRFRSFLKRQGVS